MFSKITISAAALAALAEATTYMGVDAIDAGNHEEDLGNTFKLDGFHDPAEVKNCDHMLDLRNYDELQKFKQGGGLKLKVGETCKFILNENPSTGYSWLLNEALPSDLYEVKDSYKSKPALPGMVGVGGAKEITITALKPGNGKLQAAKARPWEFAGWDQAEDSSLIEALNIDIMVEDVEDVIGDEPKLSGSYDDLKLDFFEQNDDPIMLGGTMKMNQAHDTLLDGLDSVLQVDKPSSQGRYSSPDPYGVQRNAGLGGYRAPSYLNQDSYGRQGGYDRGYDLGYGSYGGYDRGYGAYDRGYGGYGSYGGGNNYRNYGGYGAYGAYGGYGGQRGYGSGYRGQRGYGGSYGDYNRSPGYSRSGSYTTQPRYQRYGNYGSYGW